MTLAFSGGGLLVPEGALEAAVAQALRQHDDDLRLVPQDSDVHGRRVYKVYRWNGPDRPAEFVCGWWTEQGEPLPLSMALVDMVQLHDRNTVGSVRGDEEHNRRLREGRHKDYLRDTEEIVREFGPRIDGKKQTLIPRSRSLQRARQKQRAQIKSQELRP